MSYTAPDNILLVLRDLDFSQALAAGDPRYVETQAARGSEQTLQRLATKLGVDLDQNAFYPATQRHILFFGHIGSGKTTELRRYARELAGPARYLVVEVDISKELDHHNLQYADTLMAMVQVLLLRLHEVQVVIPQLTEKLKPLADWFMQRVQVTETSKTTQAELESGGKAGLDLPFVASLFSRFSIAFKTNATYKDEIRKQIRNSFSDFAREFNALLACAESCLQEQGLAQRVLFVIDNTDKLKDEDRKRFFISDVDQLLAINAHIIYTAPLALKYEGGLNGKLNSDIVLPMIKLHQRDGSRWEAGWQAMRNMLLLRANRALFTSDVEVDLLIEFCGGHPRELMALLQLACEYSESRKLDAAAIEKAINQRASDYRRFLSDADYKLLVKIDQQAFHDGNDPETWRLMYNTALLEYNDGSWRRSHPVVRRLEGYQHCLAAAVT